MDRHFDYAWKILLAIEFADAPRRMDGLPATYALFKRLSIPEVIAAFAPARSATAPAAAGADFQQRLDQRMGFWETKVPAGHACFVHYAIGPDDVVAAAFDRLKQDADGFALLGIYHLEPQSSAYPFSFPSGATPDHWHPGEYFQLTPESIFWFNFFPEQPYLFEKTFAVWTVFQLSQLKARAENNQLVAADGNDRLIVNGVPALVQVNLNRFSSLPGFFNAARDAGEHTFTVDGDYIWYGMLLRKLAVQA
jgi:hypothetical protein